MTDDNDSALGDFDTQHDSDHEQAKNEAAEAAAKQHQGPRDVVRGSPVPYLRARSEFDREIRAGDPVRDLWGGAWLIAVSKKANTVREYDTQQPDTKKSLLEYEGSIGVGATEEDAVWSCFYLNQNNTLAGGRSGPYDFPESRICRYAYEATDGYKRARFQDDIEEAVLEQVVRQFPNFQAMEDESATLFEAVSTVVGEDRANRVFELAEAEVERIDG